MKKPHIPAGAAALLSVAAAALLLFYSRQVAQGVISGLQTCGAIIIPSLFPFMILAGLLSCSPAGDCLSRAVSFSLKHLLGIPQALGAAFFLSFIGGFPVGARILSRLAEERKISPQTASYALCFCVNAGPSFLISAVGAGMFGSATAGLWLLLAQVCSSFIIAAFFKRRWSRSPDGAYPASDPHAVHTGFVEAVKSASAGILTTCAFVVAFSAIRSLLEAAGAFSALSVLLSRLFPWMGPAFFQAFLAGVLEVTNGCMAASALHTRLGFALCGFLISFASLSIIGQVCACFPTGAKVRFGPFFLSRLVHGGITGILAWIFWGFLPPQVLAAVSIPSPTLSASAPNAMLSSFCLICMCTILLLPSREAQRL